MKLREIAFRNIRRNTRRSILSLSAIAVASLTFVFLFSLIGGMKADLAHNLHTYYTGEVRIRNREYNKYDYLNPLHLTVSSPEQVIELIEKNAEVESVSPRVQFGTGIYREGNTYPSVGLGVDFTREREYQDLEENLLEGTVPSNGKNEALIAKGLSEEIGLSVGDKMTLLTKTMRGGTNAITLTITGVVAFPVAGLNGKLFLAPLDRMQYFLRMNEGATEILVKLAPRAESAATAERLTTVFKRSDREELIAESWRTISETYSAIQMGDTVYTIMAFLFFILGSTVIINTTMMVVYERTKEIGTIAAMGMTGPEIVKLFFLEAFFISIIGSAVGVVLGIGITVPISHTGLSFGEAMEGIDMELSPVFYPVLDLRSTVFVFFYSTVVASLASFIPSRRAATIKPVEALRTI